MNKNIGKNIAYRYAEVAFCCFICLFTLLAAYCVAQDDSREETNPIPMAQLPGAVFDKFYTQVMSEINKEFDLQDDDRTRRYTREYGYSFFKMEKGDFSFEPPPDFLNELGDAVCKSLGHEPQKFTNVIISVYGEGFHLEPHVDTNFFGPHDKGYYFSEHVYGIIIEADPTGHLYFVRDEVNPRPPLDLEPVYSLNEQPGFTFCLEGPYRFFPFFHAVSTVSQRRISITLRNVLFD